MILYLANNYLQLLLGGQTRKFDFSEGFDKKKFADWMSEILPQEITDRKVDILLAEELVRRKSFPTDSPEEAERQLQLFLEEIAGEGSQLAKLKIYGDTTLLILVTDKSVYKEVQDVCEKLNLEVEGVFPASVSGKEFDQDNLTLERVQQKFNFLRLEGGNLARSQIVRSAKTGKRSSGGKVPWGKVFLGLVVLIFIGGLIFARSKLPFFQQAPQTSSAAEQTAAVVETPTPMSFPTPTPSLTKDQVKIQVLNGSGVTGQAGEVASLLQKDGFSDIKTGNYSGEKIASTSAVFASQVPQSMRDDILTQLKTMFSKVFSAESTSSADYDVVITTSK